MQRIMKRALVMMVMVALHAFCLAGLVGCQGCGTTGAQGTKTVHVSVLSGGALSVNGRVVSEKDLAHKIKATGARSNTAIEVSIPVGAPQAVMVSITRQLRKAGYTKILFVRPRQARISS